MTIENILYKSLVKVAKRDLNIDLKKLWSSCIEESRGALEKVNIEINISSVCRYFEKSRQAYYQSLIPKSKKELISEEELLVNEVKRIRHLLPATGGRKLYEMLKPVLQEYCIKMGRDKLFHTLKRNGFFF